MMNRKRLGLLLVPVLLAVPLWFVKRARDNSPEYSLARYTGVMRGYDNTADDHTRAMRFFSDGKRSDVMPTYFRDSQCSVARRNTVSDDRLVHVVDILYKPARNQDIRRTRL